MSRKMSGAEREVRKLLGWAMAEARKDHAARGCPVGKSIIAKCTCGLRKPSPEKERTP